MKGGPKNVGGNFTCSNTGITSLEGSPQKVGNNFNCSRNPYLTSLEGAPEKVEHHFDCSENLKLTSLARINFYVHEIDGHADFRGCPIKSNVLGILKIRGLKRVYFDDKKLAAIMNKCLPMGDSTDCIDDLLDAGFSKEYCKW